MSDPIIIQLNGESHKLAAQISIVDLIAQLKLNHGRIAVEINREIIPRSEHADTLISTGDVVEVIHAIGGG